MIEAILIYGHALTEIFLTQINLFDIYSDFAFLTIVYQEQSLKVFFMLSMTSFVLVMLPKLYSFYLCLKVLANGEEYSEKPLIGKRHGDTLKKMSNISYDDDKRRKTIFRAFTFSEFRS